VVFDAEMRYKIPVYANSDSRCPDVTKYVLYNKGTSSVSTAFSNAADLTASLDSGFVYATLADATVGAIYEFDLEVETGGSPKKTVSGLKFTIKECTEATITPSASTVTTQQVLVGDADMKFKITEYT